MHLRLFATIIAFLTLLVSAVMCQTVSVQVETKNVGPATASYLRIFCTNDIPLAGLRIPLRIGPSSDVVIDSVSFQYTVATGNFTRQALVTDADREGFINIIPDFTLPVPTFPAGVGEICRIHFHTTKNASEVYVPADTFHYMYHVGNLTVHEWLEASDAYGLKTIFPSFTAGGINIRQATAAEEADADMPGRFSLGQNFPNPFNPSTQIAFSLMRSDHIRLDVYNVAGQQLATLAEGRYPAGEHTVTWDAGSQPSGVYFYRLTTNSGVLTRKMLLIK